MSDGVDGRVGVASRATRPRCSQLSAAMRAWASARFGTVSALEGLASRAIIVRWRAARRMSAWRPCWHTRRTAPIGTISTTWSKRFRRLTYKPDSVSLENSQELAFAVALHRAGYALDIQEERQIVLDQIKPLFDA